MSFREQARQRLANRLINRTRRPRRPRPGMTAPPGSRVPGAPKSPGITPRPGPGANLGRPRPGVRVTPRPGPGTNIGRPRPGRVRRPGGAGMDYSAMLSQLNRVPGGMSPGPMGRPTGMRPGGSASGAKAALEAYNNMRGGTAATGGRPPRTGGNPFAGGQMFAEGGEVLKTPVDKLPNEGLKKLAKSPKGRKAVARMGFKDGGIAKGGKCPSRGTIRGTGAAVRGVGFKGIK